MQVLLIEFTPFISIQTPDIAWNPLRALRDLVMAPIDRLARSVDVGNVLGDTSKDTLKDTPKVRTTGRRRWKLFPCARRKPGRKARFWRVFENLKHLT